MEPWKLKPAHDLGLSPSRRLRSVDRESGLLEMGSHAVWWRLVKIYLSLAHRIKTQGREHLPATAPFVLIANHQSHLDALALTAQLPWRLRMRTYPIAASDTFFDTTITSALAAATINALPVDRAKTGRHALQHLRGRLVDEQCVYVLFPEGTRSRDGTIGSFKPGVGMLLAETNIPAVPCHLEGTFAALPPNRRVPRLTPIRVRFGAAMRFDHTTNDKTGWTAIAGELERQVRLLGVVS